MILTGLPIGAAADCFKYDGLNMIYGRDDLISLWVADMDFPVAPAIMEALQKRLDHGIFGYNLRLPVFTTRF